jgi:hypothetical protein
MLVLHAGRFDVSTAGLCPEWGKVKMALPNVRMIPGEQHREPVLTDELLQRPWALRVGDLSVVTFPAKP